MPNYIEIPFPKEKKFVPFSSLAIGDFFIDEKSNHLCIKTNLFTCESNAIILVDQISTYFEINDNVSIVNVNITVI